MGYLKPNLRKLTTQLFNLVAVAALFMVAVPLCLAQQEDTSSRRCPSVASAFAIDTGVSDSLRWQLPSVFFTKTALDCTPCCNESEQIYQSCLRRRDVGVCDCAALAYNTCVDGGCGPCNCCYNWYLFGYGYGCWTSTEFAQEKRIQR